MRIQTFIKIACFATFISSNPQWSKANPIINKAEEGRNTSGYLINQPRNGGTTTLREKCEAIDYFQSIDDLGGIAKISFQIGFEHPIDYITIDEACAKVGVNTSIDFQFLKNLNEEYVKLTEIEHYFEEGGPTLQERETIKK